VWEFAVLLLLIGAIAVIAAPWIRRRRPRGNLAEGTLLVTGVSPRPDATGEQFAVDVDGWPTMGQLFPVVYSPNNPDNWTFAPPDAPPSPPPPPSN
jgi:hypothetical protein